MTVQTNNSKEAQKSRINALSYASYGASAALLVMAYISYISPAKAEMNASIGIILAVVLASTTAYLGRTARVHQNDETGGGSAATLKKEHSKIAHDVRNCLAVIKMDAETALLNENLPPDIKETLQTINSEADKISSLLG